MTYVIAQPCVDLKDRACVDECPVDCIYEGKRMLYIHPDECVDCGACEPVCPVEAIFYEDDTPEQWKDYYNANVDFFDDLGSPGGAAKMGVIDKDHPLVAALPPQNRGVTTARAMPTTRRPPAPWWAARSVSAVPAGLPVGPPHGVRRAGARAPRRRRRPVGRHPGRPHARGGAAGAARTPPTHRATRSTVGRRRHPAGVRGLAGPAVRGDRARRRRRAAGDRLQGADRLAADPPRSRRRRPGRATRSWPTRPTRSAPGWPAPAPSRPTR